jgi:hypothetical protein
MDSFTYCSHHGFGHLLFPPWIRSLTVPTMDCVVPLKAPSGLGAGSAVGTGPRLKATHVSEFQITLVGNESVQKPDAQRWSMKHLTQTVGGYVLLTPATFFRSRHDYGWRSTRVLLSKHECTSPFIPLGRYQCNSVPDLHFPIPL